MAGAEIISPDLEGYPLRFENCTYYFGISKNKLSVKGLTRNSYDDIFGNKDVEGVFNMGDVLFAVRSTNDYSYPVAYFNVNNDNFPGAIVGLEENGFVIGYSFKRFPDKCESNEAKRQKLIGKIKKIKDGKLLESSVLGCGAIELRNNARIIVGEKALNNFFNNFENLGSEEYKDYSLEVNFK